MSFWDSVKKFAQPYSDEDYDYDEEAEGFEDEEQEPVSRARRTSPFASSSEDTGSSFSATGTDRGFSGQVLTMSSNKQEVVLFHAKTFDDAAKAADSEWELGKPIASGALDKVSREDIDSSLKKKNGRFVQSNIDLQI